jgi:Immunity protein 49
MGLNINELIKLKSEQQRVIEEQWLTYQPDENQSKDPFFYRRKHNHLWYCQRDYAYKYFYVDNNIEKAKQAFYMCGRLIENATVKYDASLIDNAWNYFALALLSDNAQLIKRYAKLTHSNFFNMVKLGWGSTYIYCMQCIINDDLEEYQKAIQIMKDKCIKKFKWGLDVEFLEALALRNKDNCQIILQELVSKKGHEKRNKLETGYKDFISFPATTLAKLAWIKGVNVQVDTHLIPLELLPIKPNEVYVDEYDFL